MVRTLVGTNSERTSEILADYLEGDVTDEDIVFAVNSLKGGPETTTEMVEAGADALAVLEERLDDSTTIESHQLVRNNDLVDDLLALADDYDPDYIVAGTRTRNPIRKAVPGSML
jgi:nucleotide-binding universal stress UspA family protein